ncbi:MAG: glutathione S-transferase [Geminicoccaceae bacterium]
MKLHFAIASPYVRKVRAVAMELGLDGQIELLNRAMTPVAQEEELNADNPLGKIPCLITDDGQALYDSRVICDYLSSQAAGQGMIPAQGEARYTALRRQALADGILDATVGTRYETFLRPKEYQWQSWIDAQTSKWRRSLDQLEKEAASFGDTVDIGTIAVACACGYLDFRYADEGWRDQRAGLASWYESFAKRPSMMKTAPE